MTERLRLEILDRRHFVLTAAVVALLPLTTRRAFAQDSPQGSAPQPPAAVPPQERATFDQVYSDLTKGAKPTEGKISFEVPEIAENGNVVPFTVGVDSPMTDASHVRAVHILSTENPQPLVATFRFTPRSGKAGVAGRMRLAKTQDVLVLAELSDGKLWAQRTTIKVTIGGCGG